MYICVCKAISDRDIQKALDDGKRCIKSLRQHFEFDSCCGRCTCHMREMIQEFQEIKEPLINPELPRHRDVSEKSMTNR